MGGCTGTALDNGKDCLLHRLPVGTAEAVPRLLYSIFRRIRPALRRSWQDHILDAAGIGWALKPCHVTLCYRARVSGR